jgi:group I intron endonuclease
MDCKSGIYTIRHNVEGGCVYVGSSVNTKRRLIMHKSHLRHNQHHSSKLQRYWNKYTESQFLCETIEYVPDLSQLIEREQYWIDKLKAYGDSGFNMRPIADRSTGMSISKEHKKSNIRQK